MESDGLGDMAEAARSAVGGSAVAVAVNMGSELGTRCCPFALVDVDMVGRLLSRYELCAVVAPSLASRACVAA